MTDVTIHMHKTEDMRDTFFQMTLQCSKFSILFEIKSKVIHSDSFDAGLPRFIRVFGHKDCKSFLRRVYIKSKSVISHKLMQLILPRFGVPPPAPKANLC